MLLDTQYRMHPDIADLPSTLFYNSKLRSGVPPAERRLPQACIIISTSAIAFDNEESQFMN